MGDVVVVQSRHPVKGWKAVKETHTNGFPSKVKNKETMLESTISDPNELKKKLVREYDFDSEEIVFGF